MTNLKQKVLAGVLALLVSTWGFAQGNDNKRPPKPPDPPKVVVKDKDKNPPPANRGDRGKKP